MMYLITQTFVFLSVAGLLGLALGWYLRKSVVHEANASLQMRLDDAESDARELRRELTAAVTARRRAEQDRQQMAEQLVALQSQHATRSGERAAETDAPHAELAAAADDGARFAPPLLTEADGLGDDLQEIKGIGPKIDGILKGLGIVRFEQIAAWSPDNVAWVDDHLPFKGRIEREKLISQARALLEARDAG